MFSDSQNKGQNISGKVQSVLLEKICDSKKIRGNFALQTCQPSQVSVATPAEPRGEQKYFFLCKFWAVKNF